jgi:hypothetical protein
MIEVKVSRQFRDDPKLVIHDTEYPNFESRLATALVERWGMVAGEPDGEDSAGRAKLRLSSPREITRRACETASEMASEMRKRGWFVMVPTWDEMEAEVKLQKDK